MTSDDLVTNLNVMTQDTRDTLEPKIQKTKIPEMEPLVMERSVMERPAMDSPTTESPLMDTPMPKQADVKQADIKQADVRSESAYASAPKHFESFDEFYSHYLSERTDPNNRRLHVIGTAIAAICLTQVVMWGVVGGFWALVWAAIFSYGTSWAGNYFIEKNKSNPFTNPVWNLLGNFKLMWEVVMRKRAW